MKKWIFAFALSAVACAIPVSPIVQPRVTFVNAYGGPCTFCRLFTYVAGTTTPQATFTDASGVSQNTNPIILDIAGGANIWLGANSYKFVLKDVSGTTIWTTDQVNASSLLPCGNSGSIQIANTASNGLACDANVRVDPNTHTLIVGVLPPAHVTIAALGTPTSWNLDTTSPATARASLGGGLVSNGTVNQLALYAATGSTVQGTTAIPNGTTATTQVGSDNSSQIATTAYVAAPGAISPGGLALGGGVLMTGNQGIGTKVQHSDGVPTSGNCVKFDGYGNTVDAGGVCETITAPLTCTTTGCSRVEGDGTIVQWGTASGCGTGATCTTPVSFPRAFTVTANVSVLTNLATGQATWSTNARSISTSGFSLGYIAGVVNGGGGVALDGSETATWFAIGK